MQLVAAGLANRARWELAHKRCLLVDYAQGRVGRLFQVVWAAVFIYVFFLKNRFRLFSKSVARFLCEAVFD